MKKADEMQSNISLNIEILYFNWDEAKPIINKCVTELNAEGLLEIFGKYLAQGIIFLMPKNKIENIASLLIKKKVTRDFIIKKIFGEKSDFGNYISSVEYFKEDERMFLKIEINQIDLDKLLDNVIETMRKSKMESARQQGSNELGDTDKMIIDVLKSLNNGVSLEQKYKLIQLILGWLNQNKVLDKAVSSVKNQDNVIGEALNSLELSVGDVNLDIG